MNIGVEIKRQDLELGRRENYNKCPIAYALRRVFLTDRVYVHGHFAFVDKRMVRLPAKVEKFVRDFDNKVSVSGFRFELPAPGDDLKYKSDFEPGS